MSDFLDRLKLLLEEATKGRYTDALEEEYVAIKLSELEELIAGTENFRLVQKIIKDPTSVFMNMLRGGIAKPSLRSLMELYSEEEIWEWKYGPKPRQG